MSPINWAEAIGGLFIFIYFLIDIIRKITDHSKWGRE
jgi:hypothetical protein